MSLQAVAQLLLSCRHLTLTTHAKPDGDAFGSVTALGRALHLLGKQVQVLVMPPVPAGLRFLQGANIPDVYKPQLPLPESDLYVVVDTGAWAQLAPMDLRLRDKTENLLIIDHHLSGDVPAAYRYIDGQAAACAEIIAQLIDLLSVNTGKDLMDAAVCEQLFVGIASDTGWFRFSNTRPQTHELAAQFGGGGHARAAGAKIDGPLEDVVQRVAQAIVQIIQGQVAGVTVTSGQ